MAEAVFCLGKLLNPDAVDVVLRSAGNVS
jgi:hypothetical protein